MCMYLCPCNAVKTVPRSYGIRECAHYFGRLMQGVCECMYTCACIRVHVCIHKCTVIPSLKCMFVYVCEMKRCVCVMHQV